MTPTRTRLGIEAENMGRAALDPGVIATARAIEAAGADSVSVSDHLLTLSQHSRQDVAAENWLEALTCLAAISSVTERVKLIASVIILPQRNVLELLKVVSTIDALSGGRLILGVGSGWNEPEMAALGYDFATRGARMDEMLQVMRSVRGTRVPPFAGAQITVPAGVIMAPPASIAGTVPLYLGGAGVSGPSVRRTLAYGDGWMPYSPAGQYDLAALRDTLQHLHAERERQGQPRLGAIFKLAVKGHDDPAIETETRVLADLGFAEIIIQGVWNAGLEPGVAAIHRARRALAG
ncbi:MAG: TIGR03619 family F420-dependent LLM class oxidoreductase [Thermomicrobiales bacterium]